MGHKEKKLKKVQDLYIDMDGVMVSLSDEGYDPYPSLVPDAWEFLMWAAKRFRCQFLTCWGKNSFDEHFPTFPKFPICSWRNNKTEAIDYTRTFYWLDDDSMRGEQDELKKKRALGSFIKIDARDDEALTKFMRRYEKDVEAKND